MEAVEYTNLDFGRYFRAKSINVDILSKPMAFKLTTLDEAPWGLAEKTSEENQNWALRTPCLRTLGGENSGKKSQKEEEQGLVVDVPETKSWKFKKTE